MEVVLSVRVPKEIKERALKLGINIKEVVINALKKKIEETEEIEKKLENLAKMAGLSKISDEEIVKIIREDRER